MHKTLLPLRLWFAEQLCGEGARDNIVVHAMRCSTLVACVVTPTTGFKTSAQLLVYVWYSLVADLGIHSFDAAGPDSHATLNTMVHKRPASANPHYAFLP
ncbi:hypothetical protein J6590_015377 [Homalodisca vitripennis]|nr:hypothetical protein J6590_015377 [Homalodisca vitripennis]